MALKMDNSSEAYGLVSRALHWSIAALIFVLLFVGLIMIGLPYGSVKAQIYDLHKSLGMMVLLLGAIRIIWRSFAPVPPTFSAHRKYEKILAKTIHLVFYFCILVLPLSGWIMSSSGDYPVTIFWLFNLPPIVSKNQAIFEVSEQVHMLVAYGLIGSIALHILGALKHQFIDRDATMRRMGASVIVAGLAMGAIAVMMVLVLIQNLPKDDIEQSVLLKNPQSSQLVTSILQDWNIDPAASRIEIIFKQSGQDIEAFFERWGGEIVFDKNSLAQAKAIVRIDATSFKTGSSDRDAQAQGKDWFSAGQFPEIVFQSESFTDLGADRYFVKGTLNVRGVAVPIEFPFTLEFTNAENNSLRATMVTEFTLKRLDFGLGQGEWQATTTIADDVIVRLYVQANQNTAR